MIKKIKEVLKKQGYNNLKIRILISVLILIIAAIILVVFFFFTNIKECDSSECFSQALSKCTRVSYIREDPKAAWDYKITGSNNENSCNIDVRLLRLNQGTVDIEILEGSKMTCVINRAETRPPEENIKDCSGLLKERLQEIIIERMHSYILKNIGEIKESFGP